MTVRAPRRPAARRRPTCHGPTRRSRRLGVLAVALVIACCLLSACGSNQTLPSTKKQATSTASAAGRYIVAYRPDQASMSASKLLSWTVHVWTRAGAPVDHATLTVTGGMPDMGHGLPTAPRATFLAHGTYAVRGLQFSMPGRWLVTLHIRAGGVTDHATFALQIQ